jgi:hypothetical protein
MLSGIIYVSHVLHHRIGLILHHRARSTDQQCTGDTLKRHSNAQGKNQNESEDSHKPIVAHSDRHVFHDQPINLIYLHQCQWLFKVIDLVSCMFGAVFARGAEAKIAQNISFQSQIRIPLFKNQRF